MGVENKLQPFLKTESKGRKYLEEKSVLDDKPFLKDVIKITTSRAYQRLSRKTQVFFSPKNPHIRRRDTHTNEVVAISTVISESLNLNNTLCMAIAHGHDIGHTPYGHEGERILTELGGKKFKHNIFGVVLAQKIEKLNLTYETLEGILCHPKHARDLPPNIPQECLVVRYADQIAYTFSDLEDCIKEKTIKKLPDFISRLGESKERRNYKVIEALVNESKEKGKVQLTEGKTFEDYAKLINMMDEIYHNKKWGEQRQALYNAYEFFSKNFKNYNPIVILALLTDWEVNVFKNNFSEERIKEFGVIDLLPFIKEKIDYTNPDLNSEDFKY